jgi:hypothetical protein
MTSEIAGESSVSGSLFANGNGESVVSGLAPFAY